jgi:hypothetical protein
MKRLPVLLLMILCLPIIAFAAQIYGSLRVNNASVGEGVPVRIQCADGAYEGKTDRYGAYSIPLRPSRKCSLSVNYAGRWSVPFDVYPDEDPVRYDFDLIRQSDGAITLSRR